MSNPLWQLYYFYLLKIRPKYRTQRRMFRDIFYINLFWDSQRALKKNHEDLFFHLIKQEVLGIIRTLWVVALTKLHGKTCQIKRHSEIWRHKTFSTDFGKQELPGGSLNTPQGPPSPCVLTSEEALSMLCCLFISILVGLCLMTANKTLTLVIISIMCLDMGLTR